MIDFSFNQYIQIAILGGLLGTGGMTLTLYIFNSFGFANGDMVRAVGSLITKSYKNSLIPGLIIHFRSVDFFQFFMLLL